LKIQLAKYHEMIKLRLNRIGSVGTKGS